MHPNTETARLVRAAQSVRFGSLPNENQKTVIHLLRDGFAALLAGVEHPNIQLLQDYCRELGSRPVSRIIGTSLKTSPSEAAFVMGTAIHVLDFEPMFDPPTHAVSPVLGALAALVSAPELGRNRGGEHFLSAFLAGIQLQADLRTAASRFDTVAADRGLHFPFQRQGFHPPGTVGVMGSALASAIWLGLSEEETLHALGIASSRACGIAANIGTMTKATHSGNAARAGVESALLAKRGFTASTDTFAAPSGWGEVFGGGDLFDRAQIIRGMTELTCFQKLGFAFKKWPVHTAMQVAIAAALPLHSKDQRLPREILIEAPAFKYCDRPFPKDTDDARFSFQFNVAQAILDGEVGLASFTRERFQRPELQMLLQRTRLVFDPAIPLEFPKMEVRVSLEEGRSSRADRWPGHWKSPATELDLRTKFLNCAATVLSTEQAEAFHQEILSLPSLKSLERL